MREKTGNTLDVAAVTAAWDAFFRTTLPISKEELDAQGWKSLDDLIAKGMKGYKVYAAVEDGRLEAKKFNAKLNKIARVQIFYRPKV